MSIRKRVVLCSLLLLALWAFAEFTALVGYYLVNSQWPLSECERLRSTLMVAGSENANALPPENVPVGTYRIPQEVMHPYVGYVLLPTGDGSISDYGYWDNKSPVQTRGGDKLIVGIVGGSYADQFGKLSSQTLAEKLKQYDRFQDKTIVIIHLAMGGYKQPQQLLTLSYLLALGAQFDVLINFDGFNEVALHTTENGQFGIHSAFPRNWYWRLSPGTNPALRRFTGLSEVLRDQRSSLARSATTSAWRFSVLWNLVWKYRDGRLSEELQKLQSSMVSQVEDYKGYALRGPPQDFADDQQMYEILVATWKRCSIQLHRLCQANDIRYLHFLQSNQYVGGSKKMRPAERNVALNDKSPYKAAVEQAYPLLIRAGADLPKHGVHFTDLTGFFADVEEPLYIDDCCHMNKRAFDLIAAKVADLIVSRVRGDATPKNTNGS